MAENRDKRTKEELEDIEFNYFEFFAIDLKESDEEKIRSKINFVCNSSSTSNDPRAVRIATELKKDALFVMTNPEERKKEAQNFERLYIDLIIKGRGEVGTIYRDVVAKLANDNNVDEAKLEKAMTQKGYKIIGEIEKCDISFDFKEYERVETLIKALGDEKIKDLYTLLGLPRDADLGDIQARRSEYEKRDAPKWASRGGKGENLKQLYGCAKKIFKQEGDKPGEKGRWQYNRFLEIKDDVYFPLKDKQKVKSKDIGLEKASEYVKIIKTSSGLSTEEAYAELRLIVEHLRLEMEDIFPDIENLLSHEKGEDSSVYDPVFDEAIKHMAKKEYEEALSCLEALPNSYRTSEVSEKKDKCRKEIAAKQEEERQRLIYEEGQKLYKRGKYEKALKKFLSIKGYSDAGSWIDDCKEAINEENLSEAKRLFGQKDYEKALSILEKMSFPFPGVQELMDGCNAALKAEQEEEERKRLIYEEAEELYNRGEYEEARKKFSSIKGYSDSRRRIAECEEAIDRKKFAEAKRLFGQKDYEKALSILEKMSFPFPGVQELIDECNAKISAKREEERKRAIYEEGERLYSRGEYEEARKKFSSIKGYASAKEWIEKCEKEIDLMQFARAISFRQNGNCKEALSILEKLPPSFPGINELIAQCRETLRKEEAAAKLVYGEGQKLYGKRKYAEARRKFESIKDYSDAKEWIAKCERIEQTNRHRARRMKERAIDLIKRILPWIIYCLPAILTIVFGIILFTNQDQISILSSFSGWMTGWVFFAVACFAISCYLIPTHLSGGFEGKSGIVSMSIVGIAMLLFGIVGFSNASHLSPDFNPAKEIDVSATKIEKNTTMEREGTTYHWEITFLINNRSNVEVWYIYGDFLFYHQENPEASFTFGFNRTISSGSSAIYTVDFYGTSLKDLYESSNESLGITFQISKMCFNDSREEYGYSSDLIYIKRPGSSSSLIDFMSQEDI